MPNGADATRDGSRSEAASSFVANLETPAVSATGASPSQYDRYSNNPAAFNFAVISMERLRQHHACYATAVGATLGGEPSGQRAKPARPGQWTKPMTPMAMARSPIA